jgi:hypothetical protein
MPSGQEGPGRRGPGPRPARPGGVEAPASSAATANAKGHREADVAHVEHRRVDHHARVLQQRVQVAAVQRRRHQALERVGGQQHEQQEADATSPSRRARAPPCQRQRAPTAGDRGGPAGEHEDPQQHRAFVAAPGGGHAVGQRQRCWSWTRRWPPRSRGRRRTPSGAEGDGHEHELRLRQPGAPAPSRPCARARAGERQRAQSQGQRSATMSAKWPISGIMAQPAFIVPAAARAWRARFTASAASGGM